jgi:hypothetical protein
MKTIILQQGKFPYKFIALFPDGKKVTFGRQGYSDYTIHHDKERMMRYLIRHAKRENWKKSGKYTAGFWSRWVLWSKPNFKSAIKQTEKILGNKYNIKIKKL